MADEEKTEEAAPAEKGKKFPIVIVVGLILIGQKKTKKKSYNIKNKKI